jgi:type II secretory pathway pseudopilin PulG
MLWQIEILASLPGNPKRKAMSPQRNTDRPGFSFIELLVALGLWTFLLGLLLPTVQKANEAAARAQCINNLKQLGLAVHSFHDANRQFPPMVGPSTKNAKDYGTLFFHLLPYIEENNLYQSAKGYVWKNGTYSTKVNIYLCPSDESAPADNRYKNWLATTNYAGNWLIFGKEGMTIVKILDGTSNTVMLTERYQMCHDTPCAWGYPGVYYWAPMYAHYSQGRFQTTPSQKDCDPALPQTPHPSGISVGIADGSVRTVAPTVSPQTWWAATTPDGGEVLGPDW